VGKRKKSAKNPILLPKRRPIGGVVQIEVKGTAGDCTKCSRDATERRPEDGAG